MVHCNTVARIVNGLHEVTRLCKASAILPRSYDPHNVIQHFPEFPDVLKCIPKFEELDFYNIDELVKLGPAAMLAHITSISFGNATYILEKAKGEIKRVDREIKSKA